MIKIYCQICKELIATASKDALDRPLHGSMFGPPHPERMDISLLQDTEWLYLKCPTCGFRPFINDYEVLTDDNKIVSVPIKQNVAVCEVCGKQFEGDKCQMQLRGHMMSHKKDAA